MVHTNRARYGPDAPRMPDHSSGWANLACFAKHIWSRSDLKHDRHHGQSSPASALPQLHHDRKSPLPRRFARRHHQRRPQAGTNAPSIDREPIADDPYTRGTSADCDDDELRARSSASLPVGRVHPGFFRPRDPLQPSLQRSHRSQEHKQPLSHLQVEGLRH